MGNIEPQGDVALESLAQETGFLCIFSNSRIAVNGRAKERRNEGTASQKDRPQMNSLLGMPSSRPPIPRRGRGSCFWCGPSESGTG